MLDGCSHLAHVEQPEGFMQVVQAFLATFPADTDNIPSA